MSDLDVIREARNYLTGLIEGAVPGPWEIDGDGILWWRDPANPGFSLCAGRSTSGSGARLIVALRAAAPYLLGELREAERYVTAVQDGAANNSRDWALEIISLARAILATKGQE